MPTDRSTESANRQSRRRRETVLDWSAAASTLVDWLVAFITYVFVVLLLGFLGGWVGNFANIGLQFLGDGWVRGHEWGWTIGAVFALVGWPLGWVTLNGKQGWLPKRRKLFRMARGRRRRKTEPEPDIHSLLGVARISALLAALGIGLGLAGGLMLALGWFSLSMSPVAPDEWFESVEYHRREPGELQAHRDHDTPHGAMTSDHPMLAWLVLTPPAILGLLGAVLGAIDGARRYASYLHATTVSERAAREREQRRAKVSAEQAAQAAEADGLPRLASPPRRVPWRLRWRLLRSGIGAALLTGLWTLPIGIACGSTWFFVGGDPEARLAFALLSLVFTTVGVTSFVGGLVHWRRRITLLQRGYFTRGHIVSMRYGERMLSFENGFDELYRKWYRPVANQVDLHGLRWMGRAFVVFLVLFAIAFSLIFGFICWVVWQEGAYWVYLILAAMAVFVAGLLRLVFSKVKGLATMGNSPAEINIPPRVQCRIEFELPIGETYECDAEVNFQRRLETGQPTSDEVVLYDSVYPERQMLLSRFDGRLTVAGDGQWDYGASVPTPPEATPSGPVVYITPTGESYHREACRHTGESASAVPIRYAVRYYEPCGACNPTTEE